MSNTYIWFGKFSYLFENSESFLIEIISLSDPDLIHFMVQNGVIDALKAMMSKATTEKSLIACKNAFDVILSHSKAGNGKPHDLSDANPIQLEHQKQTNDNHLDDMALKLDHQSDTETIKRCCYALSRKIKSDKNFVAELVEYENGQLISYLIAACHSKRDVIKTGAAKVLMDILSVSDAKTKLSLMKKGVITALINVMKTSASKPWLFCMKALDQHIRQKAPKRNGFIFGYMQKVQKMGCLYLFNALLAGIYDENNVCLTICKLFAENISFILEKVIISDIQTRVAEYATTWLSVIIGVVGIIYNLLNVSKQKHIVQRKS